MGLRKIPLRLRTQVPADLRCPPGVQRFQQLRPQLQRCFWRTKPSIQRGGGGVGGASGGGGLSGSRAGSSQPVCKLQTIV